MSLLDLVFDAMRPHTATPLTRTCRGYCKDYKNSTVRKDGLPFDKFNERRCVTCEHVFYQSDWSKFPNPSYCVCCKKKMRTRKHRTNPNKDWRPRVE
jgi:hypothetical protein